MAYTAAIVLAMVCEELMYGQTYPFTPQDIQGTLHAIRIRTLSERIEDRWKDQLG